MESSEHVPSATLASQLLQMEHDKNHARRQQSFLTGVKSVDAQFKNLLCPGKVIGVGAVAYEGEGLTAHLVARHLIKVQEQDSKQVNGGNAHVFIIAPPTSNIISSIHQLVESHLNRTRPTVSTTTTTADQRALDALEPIQLLQYLDFAGLVESLSEVSDRLFARAQTSLAELQQEPGCVLLLQGVDSAISTILRRGGVVQANALLTNLIRQLTNVSRNHAGLLVLLDLDIEISSPGDDAGRKRGNTDANPALSNSGEILSAFSSAEGTVMKLTPKGVVGSVLEKALDTIVVIHDGFAKEKGTSFKDRQVKIVEVVKDRGGTCYGQWAIWEDIHNGWT